MSVSGFRRSPTDSISARLGFEISSRSRGATVTEPNAAKNPVNGNGDKPPILAS